MWLSDLVPPIASANRDDGELGGDDGAPDCCGHLLGTFHTQAHVTIVITNGHKGLESRPLSGSRLLLNRHDLQHLVFQGRAKESVYYFVLLRLQQVYLLAKL